VRRGLTLALVAGFAVGPAVPAPAAEGGVPSHLERHAAAHRIPGLAVAVVRDGRVAFEWTRGVDAETPFLLGSVSKPFTALAVLRLVEAGRVDLDAPVGGYLPWLRFAGSPAPVAVTVRQLLTHTSGLPSVAERGLTDRFDNAPGGLARSVRDLAAVRPVGPPGGAHRYSDANYMVLGALVEAVSGESFGAHLRRHVLDPLGMSRAAATAAEAAAVGLPAGHRYWFGHPRRFAPPFDTSGVPYGYLAASLRDTARFAIAQLAGGSGILSPQWTEASHTGQVATAGSGRYGLGWRDSTLATPAGDRRIVWHAGATPGYFAHVVLVPETGTGVVVLSNVYGPAMDAPLASAAFDVARMLHGGAPAPSTRDPLYGVARAGLVAVAGALLAALGWSAVRLARPAHPARSTRRVVAGAAGSAGGCAVLAAGAVWVLPAAFGTGLAQVRLWTPDIGCAAVAVAGLASALALARAAIAARTLARRR
jgi:CubicO group peptidase (beta-lactamase class C family)